jgi:transposase-like protein/ribosomal protein L37AE/L43A
MAKQPELNLIEFIERFDTEEKCIVHLFKHKWPDGFVCEKCRSKEYYTVKTRGLYECKHCHYQASVTANTIMHKSHTPLNKWFLAIFLASKDKRGISALTLKKDIKVSYPTAWLILHKIREAMQQRESSYQLCNIVEMDDAFVGASGGKQGRGTSKAKVLVQVSITKDGKPEYAKMTVVDNIKSETVNAVAKKNIKEGSTIKSDDYKSYKGLKNEGYNHDSVVMKDEGNDSALLWLHIVISNAKSYILGTYHGLDRMHLQRYLDEFCYRFNRRFFETELFDRLLSACVGSKTVTYQSLIIRKPKHGNSKKVRIVS